MLFSVEFSSDKNDRFKKSQKVPIWQEYPLKVGNLPWKWESPKFKPTIIFFLHDVSYRIEPRINKQNLVMVSEK